MKGRRKINIFVERTFFIFPLLLLFLFFSFKGDRNFSATRDWIKINAIETDKKVKIIIIIIFVETTFFILLFPSVKRVIFNDRAFS